MIGQPLIVGFVSGTFYVAFAPSGRKRYERRYIYYSNNLRLKVIYNYQLGQADRIILSCDL
jgi:hypothetical protein